MKNLFWTLFALILLAGTSCQEKIDIEKEKEAIIALIEEETASYYASDFERWSATYIQDSTNTGMNASKSGFSFNSGWESVSSNAKSYIVGEKEEQKEVKTPIRIKIYGESAWIVFDNEVFNNKGESVGKMMVTNFLEKDDGSWKIVYRNVIGAYSYYQADIFVINSINYAKSLGKNVEDIAGFTGDQFKTGWNKEAGYDGFVNGTLNNWRSIVPKGELKILEQDDSLIVFSANNMLTGLKSSGPQFNVTYDELLTFFRVAHEKIANYLGAIYTQKTTQDGVVVTISKK